MQKVTLHDYWGTGNIDIIVDDTIAGEIKAENGGFSMSFSLNLHFNDKETLKLWVKNNENFILNFAKLIKTNS